MYAQQKSTYTPLLLPALFSSTMLSKMVRVRVINQSNKSAGNTSGVYAVLGCMSIHTKTTAAGGNRYCHFMECERPLLVVIIQNRQMALSVYTQCISTLLHSKRVSRHKCIVFLNLFAMHMYQVTVKVGLRSLPWGLSYFGTRLQSSKSKGRSLRPVFPLESSDNQGNF